MPYVAAITDTLSRRSRGTVNLPGIDNMRNSVFRAVGMFVMGDRPNI